MRKWITYLHKGMDITCKCFWPTWSCVHIDTKLGVEGAWLQLLGCPLSSRCLAVGWYVTVLYLLKLDISFPSNLFKNWKMVIRILFSSYWQLCLYVNHQKLQTCLAFLPTYFYGFQFFLFKIHSFLKLFVTLSNTSFLFSILSPHFLRIRVNGLSFTSLIKCVLNPLNFILIFASAPFSFSSSAIKMDFHLLTRFLEHFFRTSSTQIFRSELFFLIPIFSQQTKILKSTKLFEQRNANI